MIENKTIDFGAGYFENIERGHKLATVRAKNSCLFNRGEVINADCKNEGMISIVVLDIQTRKLNETPTPLLMLDGFPETEVAVQRLKRFYPDVKKSSKMDLMTFISRDIFEKLDENSRSLLITKPQEKAIKLPELREVFFPCLAWWDYWNGTNYYINFNIYDWFYFLNGILGGLASEEEIQKIIKTVGDEKIKFYSRNTDLYEKLLLEKNSEWYDKIVLLKQ